MLFHIQYKGIQLQKCFKLHIYGEEEGLNKDFKEIISQQNISIGERFSLNIQMLTDLLLLAKNHEF